MIIQVPQELYEIPFTLIKNLSSEQHILWRENETMIMERLGFEGKNIFYNHINMKYIFNQKQGIKPSLIHKEKFCRLAATLPRKIRPTSIPSMFNEFKLNGQRLAIFCIQWRGYHKCPIGTRFLKNYHHDGRGSRDWYVINMDNNKSMWIPDLIPYQVGLFGYFQDKESIYRLDLEKYFKVMGDLGSVAPLKEIEINEGSNNDNTYWDTSIIYTPQELERMEAERKQEEKLKKQQIKQEKRHHRWLMANGYNTNSFRVTSDNLGFFSC